MSEVSNESKVILTVINKNERFSHSYPWYVVYIIYGSISYYYFLCSPFLRTLLPATKKDHGELENEVRMSFGQRERRATKRKTLHILYFVPKQQQNVCGIVVFG